MESSCFIRMPFRENTIYNDAIFKIKATNGILLI